MPNSMRGKRPFSSFVLPFRRQSRWLMPQGREKCWAVLPMMTYKGGAPAEKGSFTGFRYMNSLPRRRF